VLRAFEALKIARQEQLTRDLLDLMRRGNRSEDETLVVPNDYLEVVVAKH
jgi:hypothetical protein